MDPTDLLEESARQHEHLRQVIADLRALRETEVDDESYDRLRLQVCAEAERFRQKLIAHFQFEEEGGYFSHVNTARPGLLPQVSKLEAQHARLLSKTQELVTALDRGTDLDSAFSRIDDILDRLQRHEAAEMSLLQRSVIEDVGRND